MTEPASAIVRRLLERYDREGVEALLELIADDGVFVVPPEASMEPDVYEGHDGARRYFAAFDGAIDQVTIELEKISDAAPDTALAELTLRGVGSATRIPVAQTTLMTFRVRGGLVDRIVAHPDPESAQREIATGS